MKIQQSTPTLKTELPERLNLCSYLLDARITEGHGARAAIRTATSILNFSEVKTLSENYARILARDNIKPKERVIVVLPDTPDFVGALFGVLRLGSIAVLVNPDAPKIYLATSLTMFSQQQLSCRPTVLNYSVLPRSDVHVCPSFMGLVLLSSRLS